MRVRLPTPHRPSVTVEARAKVNLALAVGPPRAKDGYHPIASWMARIDLADELVVTRLDEGDLSRYAIIWHPEAVRTSPIDWSVTKDLSVRAHQALVELVGRDLPVQLRLSKRIPVGGGLAGGSADAAAMLLALNQLFELGLTTEDLTPIAAKLGSDVAYCLHDGPAYVDDFGALVEPTTPVRTDLVVIFPEFACPTGAVYTAFDAALPPVYRDAEVRAMAERGEVDPGALFNDLADPACAVAPGLHTVRERIAAAASLPAHVSGSGSTVFVVCPEGRAQADWVSDAIEDEIDGVVALPVAIGD